MKVLMQMNEELVYKTAKEWGIPVRSEYYRIECWSCGHSLLRLKEAP